MDLTNMQNWLVPLVGGSALVRILCTIFRFLLPVLVIWLVVRCTRSLLRGRIEREVWGRLTLPDGDFGVFRHWENTVGRAKNCDVVLNAPTVSRNHAAFLRDSRGRWTVYALAKNELSVNGEEVPWQEHVPVENGDVISLGGVEVTFSALDAAEELAQARRRTRPGRKISPVGSLFLLTLIQVILWAELLAAYGEEAGGRITVAFIGLFLCMWLLHLFYRSLRRTGFELETLAFFLSTLCFAVTANKNPGELYKELGCLIAGVIVFVALALVLRSLKLSKRLRWPAAILAAGLLGFNLLFGVTLYGERNWMVVGSISFQPSELVKLAFILVGATTLDRMFSRRNLVFTLLFSAFCVGCLGLMSDFGTALIFFATFLAIAFLRSGDLPSIAFMSSAAVFAAWLVIRYRPYIGRRFSIYLHAWSDPADLGYQQTRTMAAIADGGLFGHGLGNGWLKNIGAANTDLVFGVVSQELGLLVALCAVAAVFVMAAFAVKSAATARSTFYVIASCSTAILLVVQTMLNVLGSVDLLPLTGVTFPFVSMGGTSLICCWGLLAYLKSADTRQNAALSVRLPSRRAAREAMARARQIEPEPKEDASTPASEPTKVRPRTTPAEPDWEDYLHDVFTEDAPPEDTFDLPTGAMDLVRGTFSAPEDADGESPPDDHGRDNDDPL